MVAASVGVSMIDNIVMYKELITQHITGHGEPPPISILYKDRNSIEDQNGAELFNYYLYSVILQDRECYYVVTQTPQLVFAFEAGDDQLIDIFPNYVSEQRRDSSDTRGSSRRNISSTNN